MPDKHNGKRLAVFTNGLSNRDTFEESGQQRYQVQVKTRLLPKVKEALDAAAKEEGVSRNRLINEVLAERFDVDISSLDS